MKRSLLIAINKYKQPRYNLRGCVNDMLDFWHLINTQYDYKAANSRIITNQSATFDNILKELNWLISSTKQNDTALLYYSAHGSQVVDTSGDEVDDHLDEIIVPHDFKWGRRPFTDDIIAGVLNGLPCSANLWVIMDCCHSGTISKNILSLEDVDDDILSFKNKGHEYEEVKYIEPQIETQIKACYEDTKSIKICQPCNEKGNHVLISASQPNQKALEMWIEGKPRGIFTYSLTKILKENKNLSMQNLDAAIKQQVRTKTQKQLPVADIPQKYLSKNIFQ